MVTKEPVSPFESRAPASQGNEYDVCVPCGELISCQHDISPFATVRRVGGYSYSCHVEKRLFRTEPLESAFGGNDCTTEAQRTLSYIPVLIPARREPRLLLCYWSSEWSWHRCFLTPPWQHWAPARFAYFARRKSCYEDGDYVNGLGGSGRFDTDMTGPVDFFSSPCSNPCIYSSTWRTRSYPSVRG